MVIRFTELNMYEVENFYKDIMEDLANGEPSFILDFINVKKIDLNNIQLILSIKKFCDQQNIKFQIININSKQIEQIFKMINIKKLIGLD